MGILTSEAQNAVNTTPPDAGQFIKMVSSGLNSLASAPSDPNVVRAVLFSYFNNSPTDVDALLKYQGETIDDQTISQNNGQGGLFPFYLKAGDPDLAWDLSSVGAIDFHQAVSVMDVDIGPQSRFGYFSVRTNGATPVKLFDGPVSPNKVRRPVIVLPHVAGLAQPATLYANPDDIQHAARLSCSPDNGTTRVVAARNTFSAVSTFSLSKLGPIGAGESAWVEHEEAVSTNESIVLGFYEEIYPPG